jgi:hypothetical protein
MCVDNGMFTVSFLKEGLQKVSSAWWTELGSDSDDSSEDGWTTC